MLNRVLSLRLISSTLVFCLLLSEFSNASAEVASSLLPAAPSAQSLAQDPSYFEAPVNYCTLKEIHRGTNGRLIIHIQDAHSNLSGQENLAAILDEAMQKYKVSLVLSEGGQGNCSLTSLKKFASPEIWQRVAKSFLIQGRISGEEYLNLTSEHPMKIVGIEDSALYLQSVQNYGKLADQREEIFAYLKKIDTALSVLKEKNYPRELLLYEKTKGAKDGSDEGDFEKGLHLLLNMAGSRKINVQDFPNIQKLARVEAQEKKINFETANLEQAALLEEISQRGAAEDLQTSLKRLESLKNQKIAQLAYLQSAFKIAESRNISLARYSNLLLYREYLSEFSQVDLEAVLEEWNRLEEKVYSDFLKDADTKLIRSIDRFTRLLWTAYRIQMSAQDFEIFKANEPDFGTVAYLAFLNTKLAESGLSNFMIVYEDCLEKGKEALESFYASVSSRDFKFIQNAQSVLDDEDQKVAVLISGGYHTSHLKKLFEEKGFSFVVLTPIVTSQTNQKRYEDLLLSPIFPKAKKVQMVQGDKKQNRSLSDIGENLNLAKKKNDGVRAALIAALPSLVAQKEGTILTPEKISAWIRDTDNQSSLRALVVAAMTERFGIANTADVDRLVEEALKALMSELNISEKSKLGVPAQTLAKPFTTPLAPLTNPSLGAKETLAAARLAENPSELSAGLETSVGNLDLLAKKIVARGLFGRILNRKWSEAAELEDQLKRASWGDPVNRKTAEKTEVEIRSFISEIGRSTKTSAELLRYLVLNQRNETQKNLSLVTNYYLERLYRKRFIRELLNSPEAADLDIVKTDRALAEDLLEKNFYNPPVDLGRALAAGAGVVSGDPAETQIRALTQAFAIKKAGLQGTRQGTAYELNKKFEEKNAASNEDYRKGRSLIEEKGLKNTLTENDVLEVKMGSFTNIQDQLRIAQIHFRDLYGINIRMYFGGSPDWASYEGDTQFTKMTPLDADNLVMMQKLRGQLLSFDTALKNRFDISMIANNPYFRNIVVVAEERAHAICQQGLMVLSLSDDRSVATLLHEAGHLFIDPRSGGLQFSTLSSAAVKDLYDIAQKYGITEDLGDEPDYYRLKGFLDRLIRSVYEDRSKQWSDIRKTKEDVNWSDPRISELNAQWGVPVFAYYIFEQEDGKTGDVQRSGDENRIMLRGGYEEFIAEYGTVNPEVLKRSDPEMARILDVLYGRGAVTKGNAAMYAKKPLAPRSATAKPAGARLAGENIAKPDFSAYQSMEKGDRGAYSIVFKGLRKDGSYDYLKYSNVLLEREAKLYTRLLSGEFPKTASHLSAFRGYAENSGEEAGKTMITLLGESQRIPSAAYFARVPVFATAQAEGVSVRDLMDEAEQGRMTDAQAAEMFLDIAKAVQDLHSEGVVNRDLKSSSMFYEAKTRKVTFIDFGLAAIPSNTELTVESLGDHSEDGTPRFTEKIQDPFARDVHALLVSINDIQSAFDGYASSSGTKSPFSENLDFNDADFKSNKIETVIQKLEAFQKTPSGARLAFQSPQQAVALIKNQSAPDGQKIEALKFLRDSLQNGGSAAFLNEVSDTLVNSMRFKRVFNQSLFDAIYDAFEDLAFSTEGASGYMAMARFREIATDFQMSAELRGLALDRLVKINEKAVGREVDLEPSVLDKLALNALKQIGSAVAPTRDLSAHFGRFKKVFGTKQASATLKAEDMQQFKAAITYFSKESMPFVYLILKKVSRNKELLEFVVTSPEMPIRAKLFALGILSYSFPERIPFLFNSQKLDLEVDKLLDEIGAKDPDSVKKILNLPLARDEISVYTLAIVFWLQKKLKKIELFPDNQKFNQMLNKIMQSKLIYGLDNAYSSMEFGTTFLQKIDGKEFIFTQTHELMHRVLIDVYGLTPSDLEVKSIHEWIVHLGVEALAKGKNWSTDKFKQTLRYRPQFESVRARNDFGIESHEAAVAQDTLIEDTLRPLSAERGRPDPEQFLVSALDTLTQKPSSRADFYQLVRLTLINFAQYFPNSRGADVNLGSQKPVPPSSLQVPSVPIVNEELVRKIFKLGDAGARLAGEQVPMAPAWRTEAEKTRLFKELADLFKDFEKTFSDKPEGMVFGTANQPLEAEFRADENMAYTSEPKGSFRLPLILYPKETTLSLIPSLAEALKQNPVNNEGVPPQYSLGQMVIYGSFSRSADGTVKPVFYLRDFQPSRGFRKFFRESTETDKQARYGWVGPFAEKIVQELRSRAKEAEIYATYAPQNMSRKELARVFGYFEYGKDGAFITPQDRKDYYEEPFKGPQWQTLANPELYSPRTKTFRVLPFARKYAPSGARLALLGDLFSDDRDWMKTLKKVEDFKAGHTAAYNYLLGAIDADIYAALKENPSRPDLVKEIEVASLINARGEVFPEVVMAIASIEPILAARLADSKSPASPNIFIPEGLLEKVSITPGSSADGPDKLVITHPDGKVTTIPSDAFYLDGSFRFSEAPSISMTPDGKKVQISLGEKLFFSYDAYTGEMLGMFSSVTGFYNWLRNEDGKILEKMRLYISGLIKEKAARNDRKLTVKVLGASMKEPYAWASILQSELLSKQEDPSQWEIRVEAYDINRLVINRLQEARFTEAEIKDGSFGDYSIAAIMQKVPGREGQNYYEVRPEIKKWIVPIYTDLDAGTSAWSDGKGNIVTAHHFLGYLRSPKVVINQLTTAKESWNDPAYPAYFSYHSALQGSLETTLNTDVLPAGARLAEYAEKDSYTINLSKISADQWRSVRASDGMEFVFDLQDLADFKNDPEKLEELTDLYLSENPGMRREFWKEQVLEGLSPSGPKHVLILNNKKIVGTYMLSGVNKSRSDSLPAVGTLLVSKEFRGTGAVDILLEDIKQRLGDPNAKVEAIIIRSSDRAKTGFFEGTVDQFKADLGIRSLVNLRGSAGARLAGGSKALPELKGAEIIENVTSQNVWKIKGEDGTEAYLKVDPLNKAEFFAYKLAQAMGVNVPALKQVSLDDLKKFQAGQNSEDLDDAISLIEPSKRYGLILEDANSIEEDRLTKGSGAEEALAFLVLASGRDVEPLTVKGRTVLIDLASAGGAAEVLNNFSMEYFGQVARDLDLDHLETVFKRIASIDRSIFYDSAIEAGFSAPEAEAKADFFDQQKSRVSQAFSEALRATFEKAGDEYIYDKLKMKFFVYSSTLEPIYSYKNNLIQASTPEIAIAEAKNIWTKKLIPDLFQSPQKSTEFLQLLDMPAEDLRKLAVEQNPFLNITFDRVAQNIEKVLTGFPFYGGLDPDVRAAFENARIAGIEMLTKLRAQSEALKGINRSQNSFFKRITEIADRTAAFSLSEQGSDSASAGARLAEFIHIPDYKGDPNNSFSVALRTLRLDQPLTNKFIWKGFSGAEGKDKPGAVGFVFAGDDSILPYIEGAEASGNVAYLKLEGDTSPSKNPYLSEIFYNGNSTDAKFDELHRAVLQVNQKRESQGLSPVSLYTHTAGNPVKFYVEGGPRDTTAINREYFSWVTKALRNISFKILSDAPDALRYFSNLASFSPKDSIKIRENFSAMSATWSNIASWVRGNYEKIGLSSEERDLVLADMSRLGSDLGVYGALVEGTVRDWSAPNGLNTSELRLRAFKDIQKSSRDLEQGMQSVFEKVFSEKKVGARLASDEEASANMSLAGMVANELMIATIDNDLVESKFEALAGLLEPVGADRSSVKVLVDAFEQIENAVVRAKLQGASLRLLRDEEGKAVEGASMQVYVYGDTIIKFPKEERTLIGGNKTPITLEDKEKIKEKYILAKRKLGALFAPTVIEEVDILLERRDGSFERVKLPFAIIQTKMVTVNDALTKVIRAQVRLAEFKKANRLENLEKKYNLLQRWFGANYKDEKKQILADYDSKIDMLRQRGAQINGPIQTRVIEMVRARGLIDRDVENMHNNYAFYPDKVMDSELMYPIDVDNFEILDANAPDRWPLVPSFAKLDIRARWENMIYEFINRLQRQKDSAEKASPEDIAKEIVKKSMNLGARLASDEEASVNMMKAELAGEELMTSTVDDDLLESKVQALTALLSPVGGDPQSVRILIDAFEKIENMVVRAKLKGASLRVLRKETGKPNEGATMQVYAYGDTIIKFPKEERTLIGDRYEPITSADKEAIKEKYIFAKRKLGALFAPTVVEELDVFLETSDGSFQRTRIPFAVVQTKMDIVDDVLTKTLRSQVLETENKKNRLLTDLNQKYNLLQRWFGENYRQEKEDILNEYGSEMDRLRNRGAAINGPIQLRAIELTRARGLKDNDVENMHNNYGFYPGEGMSSDLMYPIDVDNFEVLNPDSPDRWPLVPRFVESDIRARLENIIYEFINTLERQKNSAKKRSPEEIAKEIVQRSITFGARLAKGKADLNAKIDQALQLLADNLKPGAINPEQMDQLIAEWSKVLQSKTREYAKLSKAPSPDKAKLDEVAGQVEKIQDMIEAARDLLRGKEEKAGKTEIADVVKGISGIEFDGAKGILQPRPISTLSPADIRAITSIRGILDHPAIESRFSISHFVSTIQSDFLRGIRASSLPEITAAQYLADRKSSASLPISENLRLVLAKTPEFIKSDKSLKEAIVDIYSKETKALIAVYRQLFVDAQQLAGSEVKDPEIFAGRALAMARKKFTDLKNEWMGRYEETLSKAEAESIKEVFSEMDAILAGRIRYLEKDIRFAEETDLEALLKDIKDQLQSEKVSKKNIEMTLSSDPLLRKAALDKQLVSKVLAEVFNNSLGFTQNDLKIDVSVAGQNMVQVVVTDDGAGFQNQDLLKPSKDGNLLPRIFDYGFTDRPQDQRRGTGLGLFEVADLLKVLGGSIQAANRADGKAGAVFTVRFPLQQGARLAVEETTGETPVKMRLYGSFTIRGAENKDAVDSRGKTITSRVKEHIDEALAGAEASKILKIGENYSFVLDGFTPDEAAQVSNLLQEAVAQLDANSKKRLTKKFQSLQRPFVVSKLSQSEDLFENAEPDGFIGLNQTLFSGPISGNLREALARMGIVHELIVEAGEELKTGRRIVEQFQLIKDMQSLAKAGITSETLAQSRIFSEDAELPLLLKVYETFFREVPRAGALWGEFQSDYESWTDTAERKKSLKAFLAQEPQEMRLYRASFKPVREKEEIKYQKFMQQPGAAEFLENLKTYFGQETIENLRATQLPILNRILAALEKSMKMKTFNSELWYQASISELPLMKTFVSEENVKSLLMNSPEVFFAVISHYSRDLFGSLSQIVQKDAVYELMADYPIFVRSSRSPSGFTIDPAEVDKARDYLKGILENENFFSDSFRDVQSYQDDRSDIDFKLKKALVSIFILRVAQNPNLESPLILRHLFYQILDNTRLSIDYDNANSDYVFGKPLLEKKGYGNSAAVLAIMAHEMGHNILNLRGFVFEGVSSQNNVKNLSVHELYCDLEAFALMSELDIDASSFQELLRYARTMDLAERGIRETHIDARRQLHLFIKKVNDENKKRLEKGDPALVISWKGLRDDYKSKINRYVTFPDQEEIPFKRFADTYVSSFEAFVSGARLAAERGPRLAGPFNLTFSLGGTKVQLVVRGGELLFYGEDKEELGRVLVPFASKKIALGRETNGKNDVVVRGDNVSRFHAEIVVDEFGGLLLRDLNSTNGIYVEGDTVKEVVLLGFQVDFKAAREQVIEENTNKVLYDEDLAYAVHGIGLTSGRVEVFGVLDGEGRVVAFNDNPRFEGEIREKISEGKYIVFKLKMPYEGEGYEYRSLLRLSGEKRDYFYTILNGMVQALNETISANSQADLEALDRPFEGSIEALTSDQSEALMRNVVIKGDPYKDRPLTADLLKQAGMAPSYQFTLNGQRILLSSNIYPLDEKRFATVAYFEKKDKNGRTQYVARTYYMSGSLGLWRYLPSFLMMQGEIAWFDKGYGEDSLTLPYELQWALNSIAVRPGAIRQIADEETRYRLFAGTAKQLNRQFARQAETATNTLMGAASDSIVNTYYKDEGVNKQPKLALLQGKEKALITPSQAGPKAGSGEYPDFTKKILEYPVTLGAYKGAKAYVFRSVDGQLIHTFLQLPDGRTGISSEAAGKIGVLGLRKEWVKNRIPPLREYPQQAGVYGGQLDQDGYVDMWENYLRWVPVIADFVRSSPIKEVRAREALPQADPYGLVPEQPLSDSEVERMLAAFSAVKKIQVYSSQRKKETDVAVSFEVLSLQAVRDGLAEERYRAVRINGVEQILINSGEEIPLSPTQLASYLARSTNERGNVPVNSFVRGNTQDAFLNTQLPLSEVRKGLLAGTYKAIRVNGIEQIVRADGARLATAAQVLDLIGQKETLAKTASETDRIALNEDLKRIYSWMETPGNAERIPDINSLRARVEKLDKSLDDWRLEDVDIKIISDRKDAASQDKYQFRVELSQKGQKLEGLGITFTVIPRLQMVYVDMFYPEFRSGPGYRAGSGRSLMRNLLENQKLDGYSILGFSADKYFQGMLEKMPSLKASTYSYSQKEFLEKKNEIVKALEAEIGKTKDAVRSRELRSALMYSDLTTVYGVVPEIQASEVAAARLASKKNAVPATAEVPIYPIAQDRELSEDLTELSELVRRSVSGQLDIKKISEFSSKKFEYVGSGEYAVVFRINKPRYEGLVFKQFSDSAVYGYELRTLGENYQIQSGKGNLRTEKFKDFPMVWIAYQNAEGAEVPVTSPSVYGELTQKNGERYEKTGYIIALAVDTKNIGSDDLAVAEKKMETAGIEWKDANNENTARWNGEIVVPDNGFYPYRQAMEDAEFREKAQEREEEARAREAARKAALAASGLTPDDSVRKKVSALLSRKQAATSPKKVAVEALGEIKNYLNDPDLSPALKQELLKNRADLEQELNLPPIARGDYTELTVSNDQGQTVKFDVAHEYNKFRGEIEIGLQFQGQENAGFILDAAAQVLAIVSFDQKSGASALARVLQDFEVAVYQVDNALAAETVRSIKDFRHYSLKAGGNEYLYSARENDVAYQHLLDALAEKNTKSPGIVSQELINQISADRETLLSLSAARLATKNILNSRPRLKEELEEAGFSQKTVEKAFLLPMMSEGGAAFSYQRNSVSQRQLDLISYDLEKLIESILQSGGPHVIRVNFFGLGEKPQQMIETLNMFWMTILKGVEDPSEWSIEAVGLDKNPQFLEAAAKDLKSYFESTNVKIKLVPGDFMDQSGLRNILKDDEVSKPADYIFLSNVTYSNAFARNIQTLKLPQKGQVLEQGEREEILRTALFSLRSLIIASNVLLASGKPSTPERPGTRLIYEPVSDENAYVFAMPGTRALDPENGRGLGILVYDNEAKIKDPTIKELKEGVAANALAARLAEKPAEAERLASENIFSPAPAQAFVKLESVSGIQADRETRLVLARAYVKSKETLFGKFIAFFFRSFKSNGIIKFEVEGKGPEQKVYAQIYEVEGAAGFRKYTPIAGARLALSDVLDEARGTTSQGPVSATGSLSSAYEITEPLADNMQIYRLGARVLRGVNISVTQTVVAKWTLNPKTTPEEIRHLLDVKNTMQKTYSNLILYVEDSNGSLVAGFDAMPQDLSGKSVINMNDILTPEKLKQIALLNQDPDLNGRQRILLVESPSSNSREVSVLPFSALLMGAVILGTVDSIQGNDLAKQFFEKLFGKKISDRDYDSLANPSENNLALYLALKVKRITKLAIDKFLRYAYAEIQAIGAAA